MWLCLCLSLICGCATYATRNSGESKYPFTYGEVYMATRTDVYYWEYFCIPFDGGSPDTKNTVNYNEGSQYLIMPLATAVCLIDLIPSLVFDTVLLPYDFYASKHKGNK